MHNTFIKDPDASLDYSWDWTAWLATGDSIATYTLTLGGLTVGTSGNTGEIVTAILSGGTLGSTHAVKCRIVTANGLIDERTIYVQIRNR